MRQALTRCLRIISALALAGSLIGLSLLAAGSANGLDVAPTPMASLVFSNGGRIMSMNADGSGRQVLTGDGSEAAPYGVGDGSPKVSPDGSRILFLRNTDTASQQQVSLMSMDPMGGDVKTVLAATHSRAGFPLSDVTSAEWSRHGSRIFLTRKLFPRTGYVAQIASIRPDGTGLRVIKKVSLSYSNDSKKAARNVPVDVVPSPVDNRLAVSVVSTNTLEDGVSDLQIVNVRTGKSRLFQKDGLGATWSPDGSRIAFSSTRNQKNRNCIYVPCLSDPQLFVAGVVKGKARLLGPWAAHSPDWSPDGSRIAFTGHLNYPASALGEDIYSVRLDGSCPTWLTNGSTPSETADWAPGSDLSNSPGACGAKDRPALSDVGPSSDDLADYPDSLWLGSLYQGMMPSYFFGKGSGLLYGDCGEFHARDCGPQIKILNRPLCKVGDAGTIETGGYAGLSEVNGALVLNSASQVFGNDGLYKDMYSILYSGGRAISIHSYGANPGNEKLSFRTQKEIVRNLRSIGSDTVEPLKSAVMPQRPVKLARIMLRMRKRLGSDWQVFRHTRASKVTRGATWEGVQGFIAFGRDLEKVGGVKTVDCPKR